MKVAKKLIVSLLIVGTINSSQNTNQNAAANATLAAVAAYLATRPLQAPAPVTFAPQMVQLNQFNPVFNVNPVFQNFAQQPLMPNQGINQLLLQLQAAQALRQANAQFQQNLLIAAAAPQVMARLPFVYSTPNTNSSANGVPSVAPRTQPQQLVLAPAAAHNAVNTVAAPARVDLKAASESVSAAAAARPMHAQAPAVLQREVVCTCNARFNAVDRYKDHVVKEHVKLPETECTRNELMFALNHHLKEGNLEGLTFGTLSTGVVTCKCNKKFNNEDLWENHVRTAHGLGKQATTEVLNIWKLASQADDELNKEKEERARTSKLALKVAKKSVPTKKRKKDDSEDESSSSESDSDDGDSVATQRRSLSDDESPKTQHQTSKSDASAAAGGGGDGTPPSKPRKKLKQSSPNLEEKISCTFCKKIYRGFEGLKQHLHEMHGTSMTKAQFETYKMLDAVQNSGSAAGGGDETTQNKPQKRLKQSSPDLEAMSCYYCFCSFQRFEDLSTHFRIEHKVEINKEQYYKKYKRIRSSATVSKRAAAGAASSTPSLTHANSLAASAATDPVDAKKTVEPKLPRTVGIKMQMSVKFPGKVKCPECTHEEKILAFTGLLKHLRERHQKGIKSTDYAAYYEKNKVAGAPPMAVDPQPVASAASGASAGGAVDFASVQATVASAASAARAFDQKPFSQSSLNADLNKKFVCTCNKGFNVFNDFKDHVIKDHQVQSCSTEAALYLYLNDYLKMGKLPVIKVEKAARKSKAAQSKKPAKAPAQVKAQGEQAALVDAAPASATPASAASAAAQALAEAELAARIEAQASAAALLLANPLTTAASTEQSAAAASAHNTISEQEPLLMADVEPTGAAAALDAPQVHDKDLDEWLNTLK